MASGQQGSKTLDLALAQNKAWAYKVAHEDPSFFPKLGSGQSPEILWIGCADSRIPETTILGLKPGDVFVHRNIANILHSADINAGSVIEFAVKYLKVKHIIVCGHTSCGGVNAALGNQKLGMIDTWLLPLRQLRMKHAQELEALPQAERTFRLSQLNVAQSLDVLKQNAVVIDAIKDRDLRLHGLIYNVGTGELTTLKSEGDDKEADEKEAKARIDAFRLE
ncbi:carbonic anhydrase [Viridothelium virens]|uniref:Carbonic anhydrase n=1 Tax=Viridothelium virens TaxID=1048519 RepID=A0A6A6H0F1_VIRVR|nr:carbonic anhydrase [Viridothelium virens]